MPMQTKLTLNAANGAQIAPGSTRRGFILTAAAAAASSTLVRFEVARAAIVQWISGDRIRLAQGHAASGFGGLSCARS